MRSTIWLLGMVMVLMGSCTSDTVYEDIQPFVQADRLLQPIISTQILPPEIPDASYHYRNPEMQSIKFYNVSGKIRFRRSQSDCGPYYWQVLLEGSGMASHLGEFTVTTQYCSDGDRPVSNITGVLTAADGGEVLVLQDGAWKDSGLQYLSYRIVGGTGKFRFAQGRYLLHGTVDYYGLSWTLDGEGYIRYGFDQPIIRTDEDDPFQFLSNGVQYY